MIKISDFKLGIWNDIGQDPEICSHYRPVSQDFYKAFGQDELGTIGSDTTLCGSDVVGINMIAIQALEKRTAEQREEMVRLNTVNEEIRKGNAQILAENKKLRDELAQLKSLVAGLIEDRENPELRLSAAE